MSLIPMDTVVKFNKLMANEQGRDKLHKIIQYGSRLLMYVCLTRDPKSEWGNSWKSMFGLTRDCRKILRLFKWASEYEKFNKLMGAKPSNKRNLQMVAAVGLFAYWLFDNLTYLSKGGMIKSKDEYAKYSMLGWWVGITSSIIVDSQTLLESMDREAQLKSSAKSHPLSDADKDKLKADLSAEYASRVQLYYNFVKNVGDWLISANGWNLIEKITGKPLNDGVVGTLGVVSGGAVVLNTWKNIK